MSVIEALGSSFWMQLREAAPYLLFGLIIAGILHVLISPGIILWAMGSKGWMGALKGALLGAPLPLCSCSVLPTAVTLRRRGASLSSTTSFLISTPETSIDSIAITFALLPGFFAVGRPVFAIILSILVGVAVEKYARSSVAEFHQGLKKLSDKKNHDDALVSEMCNVCGLVSPKEHAHGFGEKFKAILKYSFSTFYDDIGLWIIAGLLASSVIDVAIPADFFRSPWWMSHQLSQVLIALIVGIPLYSCATATTPLAAALMLKGLSPGAALVLLLTGPADNIGTFFVLKKEFGRKYVTVFYITLILACIAFGVGVNLVWPILENMMPQFTMYNEGSGGGFGHDLIPGSVEVFSAWLIVILTVRTFLKKIKKKGGDHDHHSSHHSHDECCDE